MCLTCSGKRKAQLIPPLPPPPRSYVIPRVSCLRVMCAGYGVLGSGVESIEVNTCGSGFQQASWNVACLQRCCDAELHCGTFTCPSVSRDEASKAAVSAQGCNPLATSRLAVMTRWNAARTRAAPQGKKCTQAFSVSECRLLVVVRRAAGQVLTAIRSPAGTGSRHSKQGDAVLRKQCGGLHENGLLRCRGQVPFSSRAQTDCQDKAASTNLVCEGIPPVCTDAKCCDAEMMCATHACGAGVDKAGKASFSFRMPPACNAVTCGDAKAKCATFTCRAGFRGSAGKTAYVCTGMPPACTDAACCDAVVSCDSFTDNVLAGDSLCSGMPPLIDVATCCDAEVTCRAYTVLDGRTDCTRRPLLSTFSRGAVVPWRYVLARTRVGLECLR
eukprot:Rhum_TRINITY_DN15351_c3_g2::Rhum_TRINITY_DN15351_c3_g2_i1::g.152303::m.152303